MLSRLRRFFCLLAAAVVGGAAAPAAERVLTTALEVRSLTPAEAERGLPVRLRGVVVFVESTSAIFVQDATSTTFFRLAPRQRLPSIGDEIDLVSTTRMGLYLPGLADTTYRVVGRRELPPGIAAVYDDLYFGRYHYQRVTVEGIVRSLLPFRQNNQDRALLRLAMGSRVIEIRVEKPAAGAPALVGHRVRITGLSAGLINTPRRQLVQPYLRVLDWPAIEVVAPAPPAADAPQISAEELLAFRVSGLGEQRIRIDGVVAATLADGQAFLQQGAMAFAVRLSLPEVLLPGDRVTVVGFPSMDRFSASVVDAELLARAAGPAPAPLDIDSFEELYGKPGDLHPGKHDARLVRVEAVVRDFFRSEDGTTLLLQSGRRTIQARVPDDAAVPPAGALVRLTGICQVETAVTGSGFASRPGLVSLRSPTAADLEILRTPPWWTPTRLAIGLALLAGLTILAGLWIASLRRQVNRQTDALRHRIEAEAALEERQRIAREFHDTLEQELAGVSLRLDALATRISDEKGRGLVAASRSLVSRIQIETRDLISDLRDPAETAGDLLAALEPVAARHSGDGDLEVVIEAAPGIPILPATIVHDLRMIAREAVTNARKHGPATRVTIAVTATSDRVILRIADNGRGFDPDAVLANRRGRFGCAGMTERARKIGATVGWDSAPGRGTVVQVDLPLRAPGAASRPAVPPPAPAPDSSAGDPSATPVSRPV